MCASKTRTIDAVTWVKASRRRASGFEHFASDKSGLCIGDPCSHCSTKANGRECIGRILLERGKDPSSFMLQQNSANSLLSGVSYPGLLNDLVKIGVHVAKTHGTQGCGNAPLLLL